MEAPRCAHVGTVVEAKGAGTVCTSCGLVLSCLMEEDPAEWRRDVACVMNSTGPRLTRHDRDYLQAACDRLSLPADEYCAHAESYFDRRTPKVYERNKRAFLAALIVIISRVMNHPRTAKEVALIIGLRQEDIYRELKAIEKGMSAFAEPGVAGGGDIVPRIITALCAEGPVAVPMMDRRGLIVRARRTASIIEDSAILGGRNPSTIAAVAVYMTKFEDGTSGWTKTQIARAAHLSPSTLSKAIGSYCCDSGSECSEPQI